MLDLTQRFETSATYWISLARALVKSGRFREADAIAQRVVQDVPVHIPGYLVTAAANHALHRHDAWINAANQVAELGPDWPSTLLWQARVARHAEIHGDELDFLARALVVQPRLIEAKVQLAEAYWRAGDLDRAHRHFAEAFAQGFPDDGLAVGAMAEFTRRPAEVRFCRTSSNSTPCSDPERDCADISASRSPS